MLRRVDQTLLRFGLEGGGAGDLLDLDLRETAVPHGLFGDREGAKLAGRLEGGDSGSEPGPGGLGDVGGGRTVAGPSPDVGGLDATGRQELAAGGQLLDLGEGLEQAGGVGAAEALGLELGQGRPLKVVGDHRSGVPGIVMAGHGATGVSRESMGGSTAV